MSLSDEVLCLFSASVSKEDENYVIEIPEREFELGTLDEDELYRVAFLSAGTTSGSSATDGASEQRYSHPDPPVEEGDRREVEIEDIGEQGDGITRVERGYVVIVPDADVGERVTVEITEVQENVGFAEVVDDGSYFN